MLLSCMIYLQFHVKISVQNIRSAGSSSKFIQHVRNSCVWAKDQWALYCYPGPKWWTKTVFVNVQTVCRCNQLLTGTSGASSICENQKILVVSTKGRWANHFDRPDHIDECLRSLEHERTKLYLWNKAIGMW